MNGVLIDTEAQRHLRKPFPHEEAVVISVDRNRWFVVSLGLLVVVISLVLLAAKLYRDAQGATEVIYIKMYADGRSEIASTSPSTVQEFYRANIDSQLSNYVRYRWDKRPATIREDYGRALLFMGKELAGRFTSPQGYFAADKAAKLSTAIEADTERYEVDFIDHYDRKATFLHGGKTRGELYRTNLYLTKTIAGPRGEPRAKPEKFVLTIDWRLAGQGELADMEKKFYLVNPLKIIIEEEVMNINPTEVHQTPTPQQ